MSHREHHEWLFRVATGWLGWLPHEAYMADMADIENAYRGRVDLLHAIFGGGESGPGAKAKVPLGEKIKAAMSLRGTRKVVRKT